MEELIKVHQNGQWYLEKANKGSNVFTTDKGYTITHLGLHSHGGTEPGKQHRYSVHHNGEHLGTIHAEHYNGNVSFHGGWKGGSKHEPHFDHVIDAATKFHKQRTAPKLKAV